MPNQHIITSESHFTEAIALIESVISSPSASPVRGKLLRVLQLLDASEIEYKVAYNSANGSTECRLKGVCSAVQRALATGRVDAPGELVATP